MDIENHPKLIKLEIKDKVSTAPVVDMTTSKVSESIDIQCIDGVVRGDFNGVMLHVDKSKAAVFSTSRTISTNLDCTDVLADDPDSIYEYTPFIKRMCSTYIGSDIEVPISKETGAADGLRALFKEITDNTGLIGSNCLTQDNIKEVMGNYVTYDIVADEDGLYKQEHFIYLPITNRDIDRRCRDFDAFDPVMQATIRSCRQLSSAKTYIRIILLDGVEFILWCDEHNLGIIGKV